MKYLSGTHVVSNYKQRITSNGSARHVNDPKPLRCDVIDRPIACTDVADCWFRSEKDVTTSISNTNIPNLYLP